MRCLLYIAIFILVAPWIVLVGGKRVTAVIAQASQLTTKASEAQLSKRTAEELIEEFARREAKRQAAIVRQLERDAKERQAATLRQIEKAAAERQASMMQKIRSDVSRRQAAMMIKAELKARKRNATSRLRARERPAY